MGASADRSSKYYRWEVRMTPDEVERAIARYGTVGHVRDVVPKRFGVSGRVIEASIVGSDGEAAPEVKACACGGASACARTSSSWTASAMPPAT